MAASRGDCACKKSQLENRMTKCLETAVLWEQGRSGTKPPAGISRSQAGYALDEFFRQMSNEGEAGATLAATLFVAATADAQRDVRARLLTKLAYAVYAVGRGFRPPREAEFGHLGPFLCSLLPEQAPLVVAWAEDLDREAPEVGLRREPVAVIRGLFLSAAFPVALALPFWELAARSELFPLRIFSEPCTVEEGAIFSGWHLRAFGTLLGAVSPLAFRRFVDAMSTARYKVVYDSRPDVVPGTTVTVPASETERRHVFAGIAGYAGDRRTEAGAVFALG